MRTTTFKVVAVEDDADDRMLLINKLFSLDKQSLLQKKEMNEFVINA